MTNGPDSDLLLDEAGNGDDDARQQLLARHRDRLRKLIQVRLDRRLLARIDPSDVIQEVLLEADRRLDQYLCDRPLPFYPWLRRLAWDKLIQLQKTHLRAHRRSVLREARPAALPDESGVCRTPWASSRSKIVRYWCCATWNIYRCATPPPCWVPVKAPSSCASCGPWSGCNGC